MPIGKLAMHNAKIVEQNQSIRPKPYRWNFGTGLWCRIFPVGPGKYKQICYNNWESDKLQTKCLFPVWFDGNETYLCCNTELIRAGLRHVGHMRRRAR